MLFLEFITNIAELRERMKFPSDEDLSGAAIALTRLQDTYRLDTSSLARGELNGVKYSSELSAADCFELGRQSYNNGDYYHTQLWMREADARLGKEFNETVERSDILEYLAFSTFKQGTFSTRWLSELTFNKRFVGNLPLALDLTNKLLELVPTHPRALGNKVYYEDAIHNVNEVKKKGEEEVNDDKPEVFDEVNRFDSFRQNDDTGDVLKLQARTLYEQLCRGEIELPVEVGKELKCRYLDNGKPFLRIAPFKIEEAYLKPMIWIVHDVMTDDEIATIKKLAHPRVSVLKNTRFGICR